MKVTGRGLTENRRQQLLWRLVLPVLALTPFYLIAAVRPLVSLGLLVVVVLPIAVLGGLLGGDRRSENVEAATLNPGDATHADSDAKIGGGSNRYTQFASSVGLLALVSFFVIAVLFV